MIMLEPLTVVWIRVRGRGPSSDDDSRVKSSGLSLTYSLRYSVWARRSEHGEGTQSAF